jgi:hypothetical protein
MFSGDLKPSAQIRLFSNTNLSLRQLTPKRPTRRPSVFYVDMLFPGKLHLGSVVYCNDSYLQITNEELQKKRFHYYNLQRQEVYFW